MPDKRFTAPELEWTKDLTIDESPWLDHVLTQIIRSLPNGTNQDSAAKQELLRTIQRSICSSADQYRERVLALAGATEREEVLRALQAFTEKEPKPEAAKVISVAFGVLQEIIECLEAENMWQIIESETHELTEDQKKFLRPLAESIAPSDDPNEIGLGVCRIIESNREADLEARIDFKILAEMLHVWLEYLSVYQENFPNNFFNDMEAMGDYMEGVFGWKKGEAVDSETLVERENKVWKGGREVRIDSQKVFAFAGLRNPASRDTCPGGNSVEVRYLLLGHRYGMPAPDELREETETQIRKRVIDAYGKELGWEEPYTPKDPEVFRQRQWELVHLNVSRHREILVSTGCADVITRRFITNKHLGPREYADVAAFTIGRLFKCKDMMISRRKNDSSNHRFNSKSLGRMIKIHTQFYHGTTNFVHGSPAHFDAIGRMLYFNQGRWTGHYDFGNKLAWERARKPEESDVDVRYRLWGASLGISRDVFDKMVGAGSKGSRKIFPELTSPEEIERTGAPAEIWESCLFMEGEGDCEYQESQDILKISIDRREIGKRLGFNSPFSAEEHCAIDAELKTDRSVWNEYERRASRWVKLQRKSPNGASLGEAELWAKLHCYDHTSCDKNTPFASDIYRQDMTATEVEYGIMWRKNESGKKNKRIEIGNSRIQLYHYGDIYLVMIDGFRYESKHMFQALACLLEKSPRQLTEIRNWLNPNLGCEGFEATQHVQRVFRNLNRDATDGKIPADIIQTIGRGQYTLASDFSEPTEQNEKRVIRGGKPIFDDKWKTVVVRGSMEYSNGPYTLLRILSKEKDLITREDLARKFYDLDESAEVGSKHKNGVKRIINELNERYSEPLLILEQDMPKVGGGARPKGYLLNPEIPVPPGKKIPKPNAPVPLSSGQSSHRDIIGLSGDDVDARWVRPTLGFKGPAWNAREVSMRSIEEDKNTLSYRVQNILRNSSAAMTQPEILQVLEERQRKELCSLREPLDEFFIQEEDQQWIDTVLAHVSEIDSYDESFDEVLYSAIENCILDPLASKISEEVSLSQLIVLTEIFTIPEEADLQPFSELKEDILEFLFKKIKQIKEVQEVGRFDHADLESLLFNIKADLYNEGKEVLIVEVEEGETRYRIVEREGDIQPDLKVGVIEVHPEIASWSLKGEAKRTYGRIPLDVKKLLTVLFVYVNQMVDSSEMARRVDTADSPVFNLLRKNGGTFSATYFDGIGIDNRGLIEALLQENTIAGNSLEFRADFINGMGLFERSTDCSTHHPVPPGTSCTDSSSEPETLQPEYQSDLSPDESLLAFSDSEFE